MYNYLLSVFKGNRANDTNGFSDIAEMVSTEAARLAQRNEEERLQRLVDERRRSFVSFVTATSLGKLLSPLLPLAEDIPATSSESTMAAALQKEQTDPPARDVEALSTSSPLTLSSSSIHGEHLAVANAELECVLYATLAPLLSRGTRVVTARAMELLGQPEHCHSKRVSVPNDGDKVLNESVDGTHAESVLQHQLPFLFVSLLLQRWRACLQSLATDLLGRTPSAQTLHTLQNLSCTLASMVAVTEVRSEEVRAYLGELRAATTQCIEESLHWLDYLTRAFTSNTFYTFAEDNAATTAPVSTTTATTTASPIDPVGDESCSSTPTQSARVAPSIPRDNQVAAEVVQVQMWRLLSLLLYWMHMLHGIPVPHLTVVSVFLSTSTVALDPAADMESDATPHKGSCDTGKPLLVLRKVDELHRCTGLSNTALLRQTHALSNTATTAPTTWGLSAFAKDSSTNTKAASDSPQSVPTTTAMTSSLPTALMSSVKVRESLLALLLSASKGALSNAAPRSAHYRSVFKIFSTVDADHDLGFVMVLTCRLLHYAFVTGAGASAPLSAGATSISTTAAAAEQVRAAVSPLLGAVSILLARFIAEERVQETGATARDTLERGVYEEDANSSHADPAALFLSASSHATEAPVPAGGVCSGNRRRGNEDTRGRLARDLPVVQHPRHVRLLGQLACGILLLTTLFQQSAQSVLDTMDHSFFFDALVTALQTVGKRFSEPSETVAADASGEDAHCSGAAAQAWSAWITAVDSFSKDGSVPCTRDNLAPLDALLGAALLRPVEDQLANLSDDPIVDEFLHAYLGLLAAGRSLRAAPARTLASRGGLRVDYNGSMSSNQSLRLETRSLDTLDQLEQTLVKVFLTAYDVADTMPDANEDTVRFTEVTSLSWTVSKDDGDERQTDEGEEVQQLAEAAKASPFLPTSCLYNLLLKHALWCVSMASMHRRDGLPPVQLLPPPARAASSPTLGGSLKHSTAVVSGVAANVPLTSLPPPLLSPPLAQPHSLTSASPAVRLSRLCASPTHSAATTSVTASAAAGTGGHDDWFLLFLVHHGLFRILLHDEHYAPSFMAHLPQKGPTRGGKANARWQANVNAQWTFAAPLATASWQRAYFTLLLLSYCLQLRPLTRAETTATAFTGGTVAAAAEVNGQSSNNTSPMSQHGSAGAGVQDSAMKALTANEELLAYETVEALLTVLRPPSYASPSSPPPVAAAAVVGGRASAGAGDANRTTTTKLRYGATWHNCLLALLTAALGTTTELRQCASAKSGALVHGGNTAQLHDAVKETPPIFAAASSVVSEALVCCGGIEYLLQASSLSASAAAATPLARDVSFRWTMCVLQGLVSDSQACVHMAARCAKPLLLGVLWHPLLRRGGQELLTRLLCQPLIYHHTTADTPLDPREAALGAANNAAVGSTTVAAADAGTLTATPVYTVPRHYRKLCEALWRVLNECVKGPLPVTNAVAEAYGDGSDAPVMPAPQLPCATAASGEEREAVLHAVLVALVDAFRLLGSDTVHGLGSAVELLPLRTAQRAIFEASKESSVNIYALLLHRLAQSWTSNASSPTTPGAASSFSPVSYDAADPVCVLFSVDDPVTSTIDGSPTPSPAGADTASPQSAHTSREIVVLITKALVGLTKANPTQREVLYHNTIGEEALVDCVANAWTATVRRTARRSSEYRNMSEGIDAAMAEESEFVRLCSYLVYESIDALDAFLDGSTANKNHAALSDVAGTPPRSQNRAPSCAWSLQNPILLSALLKRFLRVSMVPTQQCALRQILCTLTHTVTSCQSSLYLAASTRLHETLNQLLPIVALLPPAAAPSNGISLRLDAMLLHLLVLLTRCHIDVRQLKQLLMLVIHSRQLHERKALVPLVMELLSAAARPSSSFLSGTPPPLRNRSPCHFMALHRDCGPAGFRAALLEFPLEGYSISLYVRWEGEVAATTAVGSRESEEASTSDVPSVRPPSEDVHLSASCCACLFSLRTADRMTVLALMVEQQTGQLFVQYRNLTQQEVRVYVAAVLPSQEWTQIILTHRPAAFLTTAAGGQLNFVVNDRGVVAVPQVAYPLMSRGHLYVGCLGHEVDRLSVAHAFYGQVSTVYFFPFVLQEREREVLLSSARRPENVAWMATSAPVSTPPLRPAAFSASSGSRWAGSGGATVAASAGLGAAGGSGGGGGSADTGTEQWLAERATVRVDTRLSDRGHLYNLAAVLRGRTGRDSRLFTFEGTLVCSAQPVLDSMGLLGALPSVVMPLCSLLVNPTLPISFRGLMAFTSKSCDPPSLPSWAMVPSAHTGAAYDPGLMNSTNAAVLWALELISALTTSEVICNEMADSGLFVFLGQMLQLLGPSLQVGVPTALLQLLEALIPFPRLFEDALTNLFLSSEVIHAAPRPVQLTWVSVQHSFLLAHPDALPCLRALGASMFVAVEVLRVASEKESDATETVSPPPFSSSSCTLRDLEHQWMSFFEALTAPPVTISEAQSLQYLVENLRWSCAKEAVLVRVLRRVRQLVASTASPFFVQLLGRKNYAVTLIPYIKESSSEAVRMEVLLQLLCVVFRSKRTQELMNPVLLASRDTVVHVAEEVSLSWLKDVLQQFPVNLSVYLALRCGLVGQFDVAELPTSYVPLDELHTLKFAAVLLPLLMLLKRSTDANLKALVLTDLAVLLKSDAQAWRRMITLRGWYVSLTDLFASSCTATVETVPPISQSSHGDEASLTDSTTVDHGSTDTSSASEVLAALRSSGLLFTTTSMILSYTLFQALLHESYGAIELALAAEYLRGQHLHRLLHHVLCNIADRYSSRLLAQRGEGTKAGTSANNATGTNAGKGDTTLAAAGISTASSAPSRLFAGGGGHVSGEGGSITPPAATASFLGLGTATALLNLCYFFRVVEALLFYAASFARREAAAATTTLTAFSSAVPLPSASSPVEGFGLRVASPGSYTEWEELTLLRTEHTVDARDSSPTCSGNAAVASTEKSAHAFAGAYYAGEDHDPQGNVRRSILCNPDGRWLHLPLAAKCAGLLCSHSALLHLGSNGNTTSVSIAGGSGGAVGVSSSSGSPGDTLFAAVMSAASSSSVMVSGGLQHGHIGPPILKGGMLRLFGRLLHAICRMTLRSPTALESTITLLDCFIARVDRGQRGSGFLLLKRAVSADEVHEHSPIAVTMTVVYDIHELLLRRLHAAECGGSPSFLNVNAALVARMKSLVEIFRCSFEQLPAFAAVSASRAASPTTTSAAAAAQTSLSPRYRDEATGGGVGGGGWRRGSQTSTLLDDLTGEVYAAGVPTLQWLCDQQANPRRTVEAFAEVASRADYNAFLERCLIAMEREQSTDKALANELLQEQQRVLRRLQDLFAESSMSRRLVQNSIQAVMASSPSRAANNGGDAAVSTPDDSADTSFTSFFLPATAKKVTAAARAAMWTRFTAALRGTVWNLETSGSQQQQQQFSTCTKYVKASPQEQQALVHRKIVFDRDGTNYSGVSMASYSSPTSPESEAASVSNHLSMGTITTAFGQDTTELDTSVSGTGGFSRASRLRLRGGEAVLLQMPEDEDAAAEEDLLRLSAEEDLRSYASASLDEFPSRNTPSLDAQSISPPSANAPGNSAVQSVLSVACEVPYMMHCWSGSFTVRGSEAFVLIDDENKSYNQVVSEDAKPYLLRPRTFSFHLSHVTQIAPGRRFRMRRTALEVWTRDRRSCFINFADTATMNAALQVLRTGGAPRYPVSTSSFLRSATGAVTTTLPTLIRHTVGGGNQHSVYVLQENPRREPMRLRAMALWRNRLLSNFDYLLVLNLLAGRTLNDMTQYPVFPWILSDYTSSELDLTNPTTFRDLSLPMGACGSEDRRAVVRERYTEMKDLGDVPSHYFTHYSSPAVTLYFLIRLPPYTTLAILLQGGHFDHADRMFHSVQATFKAVTTSTQDVRELIPELFYLPELCINANHVDFGRRQDRTPMDDLQLPPWARNDPYTFTYRMREALESPHVSAHLHEWIDLIFGYKQRGKDAIDALNVFNWHSYEELDKNRDASAVDHQLLIDSLDNIGQTPIQLFRQPHLSRSAVEWADPLCLPTHVKVLPLRWGCVRVARVVVLATDKVLVVTGNGGAASLRMHLNPIRHSAVPLTVSLTQGTSLGTTAAACSGSTTPPMAGQPHSSSLSAEMHRVPLLSPEKQQPLTSYGALRSSHSGPSLPLTSVPAALSSLGRASLGGADVGSFDVSEEYERRIAPIPAGVIPNNSPYADGSSTASSVALLCYDNEVFLVLGGLYDNSVIIRSLSGVAADVRLRAHHGRVAFVVCTGDSRYLVTGADDTTFAVWSCQFHPDRQHLEVEMLFTIYGHEDMPSAADVSSSLDIVATASLDGVLMLHSLSTGSLDRVIRHPHNVPIHRVLLQMTCYVPNIIFLSNQDGCVHQYSINGASLRTFMPPGRVTAWAMTPSQYFLLACQPYPYVHSNTATPTTLGLHHAGDRGGETPVAATAPCILYVHSFFLEVMKTVPVPADHVVSSLSAHPSCPQVVVAGTESGRLLLLQSVTG
jgi:hypothetical protein